MTTISRHPQGTPAGGRFAAIAHPEPEATLGVADEELLRCAACGADNDGSRLDGECAKCLEIVEDDEDDDYEGEDDDEAMFVIDASEVGEDAAGWSVCSAGDSSFYMLSDDDEPRSVDFEYYGDPEDHHELQDTALQALKRDEKS